jgi:hypothetical protein
MGSTVQPCEVGARSPATNRRLWCLAIAFTAVATAAVAYATRHGSLLAPDSVTYLSMAHALGHGRGASDFTGTSVTVFGPGYPAVLARLQSAGVTALTSTRAVNVAAYAAIVLLAFVLTRRRVESWRIALGATVLIACCVQLLIATEFASTDPLFYALVLAFILAMEEIAAAARHRAVLIGAAVVVAWAAFLVRYAGLSLLVAGVITLLVVSRRDGIRAAFGRALCFGVLGSIVPVLWVIRNAGTTGGSALGLRVHSHESVVSIAVDVGRAVAHILIPDSIGTGIGVLLLGGIIAVAGALALVSRRELVPRLRSATPSLAPTLVFVLVYVPFVAAARKSTGSDLDPRILLPAWLPVAVIGAWFFEQLVAALKATGSTWLARVLIAGAVGFVGVSAFWFADQVHTGTGPSVAVSHYPVNDVALRRAMGSLDANALVVSNDPWRVYNATGHVPVKLAPMPVQPGFSHTPISVSALAGAVNARGSVTLIWFDQSPASGRRPVTKLPGRGRYDLVRSHAFRGGVRYTLRPRVHFA